jgi:signal transduction histidine kinase
MGRVAEPAPSPDRGAGFPGPASLARLSGWLGLAAFSVFLVIGLATQVQHHPGRAALGLALGLVAAVPLFVLRSRFTLLWAALATAGVVLLVNGDSRDIGWFAIVVLAAWCVLFGGVWTGIAYWLGGMLLFGSEWLWADRDPGWAPWSAGVTVSVLATLLIRHEFVLVERLKAAHAGLAERSRVDERNRIARELHDVIAHGLTVSLLHVTSARLAVEHDPADAARALAEAERLGRQSMAEVRATIGLVGPPSEPGIAPPVPGLDQIQKLVEQLRRAGADISLCVDGDAALVPGTTGSTVYRIVQEALTNATKHAPGSAVTVCVRAGSDRVEVTVDSGGPPKRGTGMGLESMQERAKAVGGTCTAGPGGRGWLVHASLPLGADTGAGRP